MSHGRNGGCCTRLHLREENARFLLLAVVLLAYMVLGATLFNLVEGDEEVRLKARYIAHYDAFVSKYASTINMTDFHAILYHYGNVTSLGLTDKNHGQWDFSGAFYFVGTVISTIGFGMSAPKTIVGRILLIVYGYFGCSGGILFFNLFLERIITMLASLMRFWHEREQRRAALASGLRRDSTVSLDDGLEDWKPSVYWVMVALLTGTLTVALIASAVYSSLEEWTFLESIYFCFVAFSTIGFGDFVPNQKSNYPNLIVYRVANFFFIVFGCCCIYSLFNVTSIVIKQFLNWLIKRLDCQCRCGRSKKRSPIFTQVTRMRRNAITPHHLRSIRGGGGGSVGGGVGTGGLVKVDKSKPVNDQVSSSSCNVSGSGLSGPRKSIITVRTSSVDIQSDLDSNYDSDGEKDFTMRDLLKSNKVSLAILQKELYESAQRSRYRSPPILLPSRIHEESDDFKRGAVGPLAIVRKTLGDDET